ncbi:LiaI-LiaF-like domain-containing protein [Caloramator mitchellensis]|nr:DUF5668 domain-containing protein [Caloramator mitchellensis]
MRRIGTISSAIGFIFLGIWMMLEKTNPQVANSVFKFWPVLFIILGAEVIAINSRKIDEKIGFNPLIIFVILIYLFVNGFQFVTNNFFAGKFDFNPFELNIESSRYKQIGFNQTYKLNTKHLILHSNNLAINVKKSSDNNLSLDGRAYFDKNTFYHEFKPTIEENSGVTNIYFNNKDIRRIELQIEIPENIDFDIISDNLKLEGDTQVNEYKLEIDNGKINLKNANKLNINCNNIDMDVVNIKTINIDGDNGNINIKGRTEVLNIDIDNAKLNINNYDLKNFKINLDSGVVNLITNEKNVDADLTINSGVCKLNNENRVNSGIKKVLGTGANKLKIEVNNGVINFKNVE